MKKLISLVLVLMLMLSLAAVSYAAPVRASDESTASQLKLIFSSFDSIRPRDAEWSYAVTDLDHNGRLELLAASIQGMATTVMAWEVSADGNDLDPCAINIPADESFPDVITENADTYYNPDTDIWTYIFYDNIVLSVSEVYYVRCAVSLQSDRLSSEQLAIQHMTAAETVYTDNSGNAITAEQYNSSGESQSDAMVRSSTNFDWMLARDVSESRLSDSYAVFKGAKQPAQKAQEMSTPVQTASAADFLSVTKSPTNEARTQGDTAYFVSGATGYTSLVWTFVSPYGGEYSTADFRNYFPYSNVSGDSSTNLTIGNVSTDMSGWGCYCTFYNNTQTARTNTAYLYVSAKQQVQTQTQNPDTVTCPNCGRMNVSIYGYCPNCGFDVHAWYFGSYPEYYVNYYCGTLGVYQNGEYTIYNGDGSYVSYYDDGSIYQDFGDGTHMYESNDGSIYGFNDNGSWFRADSDGSWESYDATTGEMAGGMTYDAAYYPTYEELSSYGLSDDEILEVYSELYGWGSYYG